MPCHSETDIATTLTTATTAALAYIAQLEARVRELEGHVAARDYAIDEMCDEIHALEQRVGGEGGCIKFETEPGAIVQLSPEECGNPLFGGCLMIVDEVKSWGVQGYVQALGENEQMGGQAYYRAKWEEMAPTGGMAVWVVP